MAIYGQTKSKAITAQNQWTESVVVQEKGIVTIENTNLVATITLQGKAAGGGWIEVDTLAVAATTNGKYEFTGRKEEFRIGVATGGFTSGAATLHLRG